MTPDIDQLESQLAQCRALWHTIANLDRATLARHTPDCHRHRLAALDRLKAQGIALGQQIADQNARQRADQTGLNHHAKTQCA